MKKTKNNKSTAVAVAKSPDKRKAKEISAQYGVLAAKANDFLREALKFGSLLVEWEQFLGKSNAGRSSSGEGLKGWLEQYCPEINYSTALKYKLMAEKNAQMLGGGAMAIAALQGETTVTQPDGEVIDVEAKVIEKRDEIFAKANSFSKLEQAYFAFMAEEGRDGARPSRAAKRRGRKQGSNANSSGVDTHIAKTAAEKAAAAEQEMRELVGKLGAFLTRGGKINMLTAQAKSDFHTSLVDYAKLLEEQM